MSELHMAIVREIGGKQMVAHVELHYDMLEEEQPSEQARILLQAYQKAKKALGEVEVDDACDTIKNLIAFPKRRKRNIPVE